MANVTNSRGEFDDLGRFKSKKCVKVMDSKVCDLNFQYGKVTILESDLKKVCKK